MKRYREVHKKRDTNLRIYLVFFVFIIVIVAIFITLYDLQIIRDKRYPVKFTDSWFTQVERGFIFDRNGAELAIDIPVESVYANPKEIKDIDGTAKKLSLVLKEPTAFIKQKLLYKKTRSFIWIKRKVTPIVVSAIKRLRLDGIYFFKEYKRYYPKSSLAANIVGFVGLDNQGLAGIEYLYEDIMDSDTKMVIGERDGKGRYVSMHSIESDKPFNKCDVILTIDEVIQHISQNEVKKKVEETRAKGGIAIVMVPYSGEVLAIAKYPEFNPNKFADYPPHVWLNSAISSTFEPGSTFKVVMAAAALEEGLISPEDVIFCEDGHLDIAGITIHDIKPYGALNVKEIIAHSSNVGAVKIGLKLGKERYYNYIKRFGFGSKTGIDLPGEVTGVIRHPSKWSGTSIAAISIGHEISVTPIQLVRAFSAIVNEGDMLDPIIVRQIVEQDREIDDMAKHLKIKVISNKTSNTMKGLLEYTVTNGTGRMASVPGFRVGGKTGTTRKIDKATGRYSTEKFLASFIGVVPVENPSLVILVLIDEPQTSFYGGDVAAPVFSRIAEQSLRYLRVPSDNNIELLFAEGIHADILPFGSNEMHSSMVEKG